MPLSLVGTKLPDLELEAFHKDSVRKISLKSLHGKWTILFFYPADFTFVCPTELEDLAAKYSKFQGLNTEVLSVSTDTVFVHKAWHDNSEAISKVNFPMIADPTGALCKALRTYIPHEGLSLRATVIIDPDGVIKAYEMHDNSIGRNIDELVRKVQAAQFVREHGDQVCPVNWTPGSNTLRPRMDLVGKI